jgi:hypothetical protein
MESNYTDTVSGEELYINVNRYSNCYFKDKKMSIRHRLDGPAVEFVGGDKYWFVDNERHRLDGPAVDNSDGDKHWYINGVCIFGVDRDNRLVNRMK